MNSNPSMARTRVGAAFYAWLRDRWTAGLALRSDISLILVASVAWAVLYNLQFWHQAIAAMWHPTPGAVLFLVSLCVVVVCLQALLLALVPTRLGLRIAASALFLVAAISSYFASAYGAVMNQEMMRNVIETDPAEVGGLISFDLLAHVALLGVAARRAGLARDAPLLHLARAIATAAGLRRFRARTVRSRAVRLLGELRSLLSRAQAGPLRAESGCAAREFHWPAVREGTSRSARTADRPRRQRAAHRGGPRQAAGAVPGRRRDGAGREFPARRLCARDEPASCSTGRTSCTSIMRRRAERRRRSPCRACSRTCRASASTSIRPTATRICSTRSTKADFDVEWRDNNAGCKGVCARVVQVAYPGESDPVHCPNSYCYDEVMLSDLAARLETLQQDTVVIFHAIGSHGPAYAERYPPQFEVFKPACRSNELQRCTEEEVVNAYDNSIAYTDTCCREADRPAASEREPFRQRAALRLGSRRIARRAGNLSARHAVRVRAARRRRKCRCCSGPREATSSAPA